MATRPAPAVLTLWCLAVSTACPQQSKIEFPWCVDPAPPSPTSTPVTWHQDVKPIIWSKCMGCHASGGIAPLPLETYADVSWSHTQVRAAVASRRMPPWPPAHCCQDFKFDRSLSDAELATVLTWLDQGAPEGVDDHAPLPSPTLDTLARVDLTIPMPEAFTPSPGAGKTDQYRCFLMDWPKQTTTFVTGVRIIPGTIQMVHHAILMWVKARDVATYQNEDTRDDGPGFKCPGGLPDSVIAGSMAGWVPGATAHDLPDGVGFKVEPGDKLILGMHYTTANGVLTADTSSVELKLDAQVSKEAVWISVADPAWYGTPNGLTIPAGASDTAAWYHYDPTAVYSGFQRLKLFNADLHMHGHGSHGGLGVLHLDGTKDCLLNVPKWDFHWAGDYWFKDPVLVNAGDQLYLECHWDNSKAAQPVIQGQQAEPQDLHWQEDQEMCSGYFLAVVE